jgi:ribosomal protein S18 acetylase RimI-like enzyme
MAGIRAAKIEDVPGIARVHVDSWRTTYKGIMPDELLDNLTYERRERQWAQVLSGTNTDAPQCVFVVEGDGGQIVGFAHALMRASLPDYDSELLTIYLLAENQGVGIGKQLFEAVTARLREFGAKNMLLWVATENLPSVRFYERRGGKFLASKIEAVGSTEIPHSAYGYEL